MDGTGRGVSLCLRCSCSQKPVPCACWPPPAWPQEREGSHSEGAGLMKQGFHVASRGRAKDGRP